jgi:Ca2+-binding RTX toxin-like protein
VTSGPIQADVDNAQRFPTTAGVQFGRNASLRLRWHGPVGRTVTGTEGPDVIQGTSGDDVVCALGGNDIVYGGGGSDTIYGGPGNDEIHGDDVRQAPGEVGGSDTVYAGAGSDSVSGGPGRDLINTGSASVVRGVDVAHGDDGDDIILGGGPTFSDQLMGDAGDDVLFPFPLRTSPLGNDVIGGAGDDIAILVNGMMDGFTAGEPLASVSIPIIQVCKSRCPSIARRGDLRVGNWPGDLKN